MGVKLGVLALQGNVSEHIRGFERALSDIGDENGSVVPVRRPGDLSGLFGLAIPGGESTTISRLIQKNGLFEPLVNFKGGIFATCAGMVLMATRVDDARVKTLGLLDMTVLRNAFGRQKESFEAEIPIKCLDEPYHAYFIRAPVATETGNGVEVLARIDAGIVAVRKGPHMALSFHPELGNDFRLHRVFLKGLGIGE
ncbi:MAG: pyridoxal 5'-phosphate synthase glutaminase subunit PdxT [Methanolinea sp.]|nr:pyridoxal 5'-phosphate synthase glutaminase subunit PdxT [Methanolinea sp.]